VCDFVPLVDESLKALQEKLYAVIYLFIFYTGLQREEEFPLSISNGSWGSGLLCCKNMITGHFSSL